MSPEQLLASGVADAQADLWGLAVCTYFAVVGRLPFDATTIGDLVKQVCLHAPPVPSRANHALPSAFDVWFARACASNPQERFQSGYEFARELQAACGVSRASLLSVHPTPPSVDGTPPMGVARVREATDSSRPETRTKSTFLPQPPRAPTMSDPSPRTSADATTRTAAVRPPTAEVVPYPPTAITMKRSMAPPRPRNVVWSVALVLMLCGIAFALGAKLNP